MTGQSMPQNRMILHGQLLWLGLSAFWNIAGVLLIGQGMRAIGPTASLPLAAILLIVGGVMYWAHSRMNFIYVLLSLLAIFAAGSAVLNAFTADPALWPSEFWRLAGAALNAFGTLCSAAAVLIAIRSFLNR